MLSPSFLKAQLWPATFPNSNIMASISQRTESKFQTPAFHNISSDMRNRRATEVLPDFTKKCHFTIQLYPCGHKTWLNKPRIRHIHPYCLLAYPADPLIPTKVKEQGGNKSSKTRCTNMASKPKEVHMTEICSSCEPFVFDWGGEKKETAVLQKDIGIDGLEERLARMRISDVKNKDEIGKDAEGNSRIRPEQPKKDEQTKEMTNTSTLGKLEAEESSPVHEEIITRSTSSASSKNIRKEETVKEETESNAVGTAPQARTLFGSFVNMFKGTPDISGLDSLKDDEPIEIWTEIDEDPDWDKIDGKKETHEETESDDEGVWIDAIRR